MIEHLMRQPAAAYREVVVGSDDGTPVTERRLVWSGYALEDRPAGSSVRVGRVGTATTLRSAALLPMSAQAALAKGDPAGQGPLELELTPEYGGPATAWRVDGLAPAVGVTGPSHLEAELSREAGA